MTKKVGKYIGISGSVGKTSTVTLLYNLIKDKDLEYIKLLEDYCIDTLNLNSIYGKVQSMNRACRLFWEKYGYDKKDVCCLVCNVPLYKTA